MNRIGLIAAFMALAAPAAAHDRKAAAAPSTLLPPAAREAARTVDAFHAALARGDTRGAAAYVADDALIFEEGGAERSKAEYAAEHLGADAQFSRSVTSLAERRTGRADRDFAWIASEGRTTGTFRGKAVDRRTTETMILRRIGKGWKIVHVHWSSAAAH